MTNKLCITTITALLVLLGQYAHAGTYIRGNVTSPVAAVMGPFSASSPNPNIGTTTTPTTPQTYTQPSRYIWQWYPDNNDIISDPPPSQHITHSYALGGGPLTAKVKWNASASAEAAFSATLVINTQSLEYSAAASADGSHNASTSLPTTLHSQTIVASQGNNLISSTGKIDVTAVVAASGKATATTEDESSNADATTSGRIKTYDVTLAP